MISPARSILYLFLLTFITSQSDSPVDLSTTYPDAGSEEEYAKVQPLESSRCETISDQIKSRGILASLSTEEFLGALSMSESSLAENCKIKERELVTLPMGRDTALPILIQHYSIRNGAVLIRGQVLDDDLSLLSMSIVNGKIRGSLIIPGVCNLVIRSLNNELYFIEGESLTWICGNSS